MASEAKASDAKASGPTVSATEALPNQAARQTEFTGERVIPGQVDVDLWNEHLARYLFATRLARRKRVLDVGCGAGYGSMELASVAASVVGIDVSEEAVAYAADHYRRQNLRYEVGSALALPAEDGSIDLLVAFEVIEHLEAWPQFLAEAARVLAPGGQFVVSTPNKAYYAESRKLSGPNPFHAHEFTYDEFHEALTVHFPHVAFFAQNHSAAITFRPIAAGEFQSEVRFSADPEVKAQKEESHFFVAVCAKAMLTGSPDFVFVPAAANVLRERERHIARLESELVTKNQWLAEQTEKLGKLVEASDRQTEELKNANRWALTLNGELEEARANVAAMQQEMADQAAGVRETVSGYEAQIAKMESEANATVAWAQGLDKELEALRAEQAKLVELLAKSEALVEERTAWAQSLDKEVEALRAQVAAFEQSRWHKFGRRFGLGPQI